MQRKLSIVAPTYNESDNIAPFIERAKEVLGQFDWEIIFVDDNSPDGTGQKAFDYSMEDRRIRSITRLSDRGLAKSSIQGLLSARGELLCVMDVDGQHDPAVINEMAERLESDKLHVVSAARRLEQDKELEGLSPIRQKLSTFGNWLSSRVLGRKVSAHKDVPVDAGDNPSFQTPPDVAGAQRQLKVLQWVIPVLTGALVVVSAYAGEQQRASEVKHGVLGRLLPVG